MALCDGSDSEASVRPHTAGSGFAGFREIVEPRVVRDDFRERVLAFERAAPQRLRAPVRFPGRRPPALEDDGHLAGALRGAPPLERFGEHAIERRERLHRSLRPDHREVGSSGKRVEEEHVVLPECFRDGANVNRVTARGSDAFHRPGFQSKPS
jgi:hypothetical protein